MVTYAERAGYVLDKRSMSIKAPPPDQSGLLENGLREERLGENELLGIDAIF